MGDRCTFIISGPSGVGKGTICDKLLSEMDDLALSVSCTTRAPRLLKDGGMEQDGVHYHFITDQRFQEMVEQGDFYEYAQVHSCCYGTSRSFVEKQKAMGRDIILEIDMQGALQVKALDPHAVLIYVMPPTYDELRRRLVGRGSESCDQVQKRLHDAKDQLAFAYAYDYLVINDDIDEATSQIRDIIRVSRLGVAGNKRTIDKIKKTFQEVE